MAGGGAFDRIGGGGGVMRRKAGRAAGGGRVGGGTEGCAGATAGAGWLCRKLDGGGGVNPGRDQATCEGGGGALDRNVAGRGFGLSLAEPPVCAGAELAPAAWPLVSCVSVDCADSLVSAASFVESSVKLAASFVESSTEVVVRAAASAPWPESSLNQSESSDSVLGRADWALGGPSEFESIADVSGADMSAVTPVSLDVSISTVSSDISV